MTNEYGSAAYRGSWFLFTYKGENIRIGWRKRVIEIDWSRIKDLRRRRMLAELFSGIEETHADTYLHANNAKQAAEGLMTIREFLDTHSSEMRV